jgi:hypothetical protein
VITRPGTAAGVIFLTLEDKTGTANVIVWKQIYEASLPNSGLRLHSAPAAMLCLIRARIYASCQTNEGVRSMVNRLKMNEKNVREAENLGRDYQIFDTDVRWFSITIYPSGNRSFTLDYRVGGRQRRMTIGRWPEWNTVAARERAKELRRDIDEGIDPLSQKESARDGVPPSGGPV